MVANLPYSVATPVIMDALPVCERFCVMVQREIADRLFAAPGRQGLRRRVRAGTAVLPRLAMRPVSRNVFTPVPRVDSALVAFERRSAIAAGRRTGRGCRRSCTPRSPIAASGWATRCGWPAWRRPPDLAGLRAEQLAPEQFLELL